MFRFDSDYWNTCNWKSFKGGSNKRNFVYVIYTCDVYNVKCGLDYQACYIMFIITTMIFCVSNLFILHNDLKYFELRNYLFQAVLPSAIAVVISFALVSWMSNFFPNTICSLLLFVLTSSIVTLVISFLIMLQQNERLAIFSYIKNKFLK